MCGELCDQVMGKAGALYLLTETLAFIDFVNSAAEYLKLHGAGRD